MQENKLKYIDSLNKKTILITGAGGGIGFKTAKNFVLMGARVLILEINDSKGKEAEKKLNLIRSGSAYFYSVDLADEIALMSTCNKINERFGCPDIIFNNAAIILLGNIGEVSSEDWDLGYRVNFKAPVLITGYFLKQMKVRNSGTCVFVSSSGPVAGMGPYEIFKNAQVDLSNTLSMELEGTNIFSYTISPGLVKTETAMKSIEVVAGNMGISTEEFYRMNDDYIISINDAALGFALSVLKANQYNGQEKGSIQVLREFDYTDNEASLSVTCDVELLCKVCDTYNSQYQGWKNRNIFERQWVFRDFKKTVGKSADSVSEHFNAMKNSNGKLTEDDIKLLNKMIEYWEHQYQLLQGFERDKEKLKKNSEVIKNWISDIQACIK